jgi:hypothetical protein
VYEQVEHDTTAPWVSKGGRVVLLGDAAHAMAPFLGQGANQAIQDGYCLADRLAANQPGLQIALSGQTLAATGADGTLQPAKPPAPRAIFHHWRAQAHGAGQQQLLQSSAPVARQRRCQGDAVRQWAAEARSSRQGRHKARLPTQGQGPR